MAEQIVSQDEIDELLQTVSAEQDEATSVDALAEVSPPHPFDFRNYDRLLRDLVPALETLHEKLARGLGADLSGLLQRPVEVTAGSIRAAEYGAYMEKLRTPTSMRALRAPPAAGEFLVVLTPELVAALVDNYFGGHGGSTTSIEGRDFTLVERRLIDLLTETIQRQCAAAWKSIVEFRFEQGSWECNPQFAELFSPSALLVIVTLAIELDGGGGEAHLAYPWVAIEPLQPRLRGASQDSDAGETHRWQSELRKDLKTTEITIRAGFADSNISLRDLLRLRPGDVIPIGLPRQITLYGEDIPLFRAGYGTQDGYFAVQVHDLLRMPQGN